MELVGYLIDHGCDIKYNKQAAVILHKGALCTLNCFKITDA